MSALLPSIAHTPEDSVRILIVQTMQAEFNAFLEQLEECSAKFFAVQPPRVHSVAWHALHIMDWTRCMIRWDLKGVDPTLTYSYLGFEQEFWAKAVYGPTLAHEQDSKDKIISILRDVMFDETIDALKQAPLERFKPDAMWTTLTQPRPVLLGLMYHIRHTAYHRGQVQQIIAALKSTI